MTRMRRIAPSFAVGAMAGLVLAWAAAAPAPAQTARAVRHAPLDDLSPAGRLALLEEHLRYPPESTPIDGSYWDLLHPWSVNTAVRTMIPAETMALVQSLQSSGVPMREAMRQAEAAMPAALPTYRFEMNRTILAGTRDMLEAHLLITAAGRVRVVRAEMIGAPEFGRPNLGEVPFTCDAAATDCAFRWRSPSAERRYWGSLRLQVTVAAEGFRDPFLVHESFYSSPMVAGSFTGQFADRIVDGSLEIDAGVEVRSHMACLVSANLYSADRRIPLQHAERRLVVDPSMRTIPFTFFGKIFRDYGDQGAFRLEDLQAQCRNLDYPAEWSIDPAAHRAEWEAFQRNPVRKNEPDRIYFAFSADSYVTRSYDLGVFSDAEWQSPEKTAQLEALRRAAANLAGPAR